jgi:zinc transport system substrate-binding protein
MKLIFNNLGGFGVSRRARAMAVVITAGLFCSTIACSSSSTGDGKTRAGGHDRPVIVTSFYPIQWLATELVGDHAEVVSLTPAGTEPHDVALDADGQKALGRADVVLYLGADFQPDIQRAITQLRPGVIAKDLLTAPSVELLTADGLGKEALPGNTDPHVWLSPVEMLAMAEGTATAITAGAPKLAGQMATALPTVRERLRSLDTDYRRGLSQCACTVLVTSHAAFGYLAHEYGLKQVPIAGVTPEREPNPKTLQSIAEVAKQQNVTTVFFEDALPNKLSPTVADEIGAQVSLLSALEFDPRGSLGTDQNYLTVMSANLGRIKKDLQCAGS